MLYFLINIIVFLNYFTINDYIHKYPKSSNYNNIHKYQIAYTNIIERSDAIKNWFWYDSKKPESISIYVSPRIYYISRLFFITNIVEYEFKCIDSIAKRKIERLMLLEEYWNMNKYSNDSTCTYIDELSKLNNRLDYDLKLFFGEIDEFGRLSADLVFYIKDDNYSKSKSKSNLGISFLFYFKYETIEKTMVLEWTK